MKDMSNLVMEVARLVFGLMLMMFHRQIADCVLQLDEVLTVLFRQRGLTFPAPPKQSIVHNVYFALGLFVCGLAMVRIYTLVPH
jgi:hypothetical protein